MPDAPGPVATGGSQRASLSVVLITLNEAASLPRCLESVSGLADEILVVDAGSRDATVEIAVEAGCRVMRREFDGYGPQKQFALQQAGGDWLLCLDADEWLDLQARTRILGLLQQNPGDRVCGIALRMRTRYLGRWVRYGPWAGEKKLRLVRRGCAYWERTSVHESLRLSRGVQRRLPGHILHEPYRSLGHQLAKLDRYTDLIAERDGHVSAPRAWFGVIFEPWLVFLHRYVIQLGMLDGLRGLLACALTGYYFFIRYAKILLAQEK